MGTTVNADHASISLDKKAKSSEKAVVKSSIYVPTEAHKKLREIAFTTDCKVHDLYLEGINRVLESRGFPPVTKENQEE